MLNPAENSLIEQTELQFKAAAKQTKYKEGGVNFQFQKSHFAFCQIAQQKLAKAIWEFWEWGRIFGSRNAVFEHPFDYYAVHYARDYAEFNLDHPAAPFTPPTTFNLRLHWNENDKFKL